MNFSFAADHVLEDARTRLRPLADSDHADLLPVALSADDLVRYSPFAIHSDAHLQQFIQDSLNDRRQHIRYPFLIWDKQEAAVAGSTSIASVSNRDRRLEIGWTWIGPRFQRTGLNRHCKYLLLQFAFDTLDFERVEFRTDARNTASRTAMEKMGATCEGTLRSHTLMRDGHRRDTVYYSILKPEWQALKAGWLRGRN